MSILQTQPSVDTITGLQPQSGCFGMSRSVWDVLKKISSESRLVQQEHSDLITSLSILRKKLIENESKTQALNKKNTPIQGFIQCIQAHPFSVICFNDTGVRLYHQMAKYSPIFCDATGTIVSVPSIDC